MSYQQKEIFRLNKQLLLKQEQFKRERTILIQKIDLLTSQVSEYQEKQIKNKHLNESIIMTYRQNQSFREQLNQRELQNVLQQHQTQLNVFKQKHGEEKKQYQEQIQLLRTENQRLRIDAEKSQLQHQKNIAEIKRDFQEKNNFNQNDLNVIYSHKISMLTQKLKQAEEMVQLYKDQLDSKVRNPYSAQSQCQDEQQENQSNFQENKDCFLKAKGLRGPKNSQQGLSLIQMRINKALVQLNPNQKKLQERIRDLKFKIY